MPPAPSSSSAIATSPPAHQQNHQEQQRTTAPVLEFVCLFTHDLKRKQKRWQDGKLRYHAFNGKVVVHDDRGNLVGDAHSPGGSAPDDGDEIQLERGGGALVQVVSGVVGRTEQDLSGLLDKRVVEREERARSKAVAREQRRGRLPVGRGGQQLLQQHMVSPAGVAAQEGQVHVRHRPLHSVIGTPTGHHGRAVVSSESPFEQRLHQQQQHRSGVNMNHTAGEAGDGTPVPPAAKRRRVEDSPPSKAGYAQNLFGTKLHLSSQPTSSLQSLRAELALRKARERREAAGVEAEEEVERERRPPRLVERVDRPAIVLSDDDEDVPSSQAVSRNTPEARPGAVPATETTGPISVWDLQRQSLRDLGRDDNLRTRTSQTGRLQARQDRSEPNRTASPPPAPEIIDVDKDDDDGPPAPREPFMKRKQTRPRSTKPTTANDSRTKNAGPPLEEVPERETRLPEARRVTPASDEPRTELRIKSRKKRGLLMVSENAANPKPVPKIKPRTASPERTSSQAVDAERLDPFASSPVREQADNAADQGFDAQEDDETMFLQDAMADMEDKEQEGDTQLAEGDKDVSPSPDEEATVPPGVLRDCTNIIQLRSAEREGSVPLSPTKLRRQGLRVREVTPVATPTPPPASVEETPVLKGNQPSPVATAGSDDIQITKRRRVRGYRAQRNEETTSEAEDPCAVVDEDEFRPTKKLGRKSTRDSMMSNESSNDTPEEEVRPRPRTKQSARPVRREKSVTPSSDKAAIDPPPARTRSKRQPVGKRKEAAVVHVEDNEDEASEDLPPPPRKRFKRQAKQLEESPTSAVEDASPPPKRRSRRRNKDDQDDDSHASAKEAPAKAKEAPRFARLSRKSVKSRELIGFMFDEPSGPVHPLLGMANAATTFVDRSKSESDAVVLEQHVQKSEVSMTISKVVAGESQEAKGSTSPSPELKEDVDQPIVSNHKEQAAERVEIGAPIANSPRPPSSPPAERLSARKHPELSQVREAPELPMTKPPKQPLEDEPQQENQQSAKQPEPTKSILTTAQTDATEEQETPALDVSRRRITPKEPIPRPPYQRRSAITRSVSVPDAAAGSTEGDGIFTQPPLHPEGPYEPPAAVVPDVLPAQADTTQALAVSISNPLLPTRRLFRRHASIGLAASTGSGLPRIVNPASRGRKAALKSDAAGQVPRSIIPPAALAAYAVPPPLMPPIDDGDVEIEPQPRPKKVVKKMTFPGFQTAGAGSGPWSREAFDLLEAGRPL